jgi:hypothetical protein
MSDVSVSGWTDGFDVIVFHASIRAMLKIKYESITESIVPLLGKRNRFQTVKKGIRKEVPPGLASVAMNRLKFVHFINIANP